MKSIEIEKYIRAVNDALNQRGIRGEIGIVGGAAMCLAFKAREATKDVDAIFEPSAEIRLAVKSVAEEFHLAKDWLNDAVKGFIIATPKKKILFEFSHLTVWTPEADYLLAMKCISARWDTSDRDDVIFLAKYLKLSQPSEVFSIIESYYPKSKIPTKTEFFIEEIFDYS